MMREPYWGLFWSTGMPEAWLMSRSGERTDAGLKIEGPWGLSGPPTGVDPGPSGGDGGGQGPI